MSNASPAFDTHAETYINTFLRRCHNGRYVLIWMMKHTSRYIRSWRYECAHKCPMLSIHFPTLSCTFFIIHFIIIHWKMCPALELFLLSFFAWNVRTTNSQPHLSWVERGQKSNWIFGYILEKNRNEMTLSDFICASDKHYYSELTLTTSTNSLAIFGLNYCHFVLSLF